MIKRILSIILGLVASVVTIMIVESIGHFIYPLEAIDMNNKDVMNAFMKSIPTGAVMMVLVSWLIGAFVGGLIASLIEKATAFRNSVVIGVIILILSIINLITIPSPIWMWLGAIVLIIPFAIAGNKLVVKLKK